MWKMPGSGPPQMWNFPHFFFDGFPYSLIFLKSGLSTLGDIDNVLLVGPIAPATYRL